MCARVWACVLHLLPVLVAERAVHVGVLFNVTVAQFVLAATVVQLVLAHPIQTALVGVRLFIPILLLLLLLIHYFRS